MNKGSFIVFEGINGAGKTTIINKIYNILSNNNINVKIIKFPNRTTNSGKIIDKFLKNEHQFQNLNEQIKIFADNRNECKQEITELINNNYIILCDRYIYSNIAYTLTDQTFNILENKYDEILSYSDIIKYDENLIKPDYVFLINGDFIHLRTNEIKERYHDNNIKNYLIFNNYIHALKYTDTKFSIINNNLDNLDDNLNNITNLICNIDNSIVKYF
jgi:dTMP kinase